MKTFVSRRSQNPNKATEGDVSPAAGREWRERSISATLADPASLHDSQQGALTAQGKLLHAITSSPYMVAQRQQIHRMFGESAPAPVPRTGAPVQRYTKIGGDKYEPDSRGALFGGHELKESDYGYEMTRTKHLYSKGTKKLSKTTEGYAKEEGKESDWKERSKEKNVAFPEIKVAKDGMMALEAEGQPSWFYADPSIVTASNKALEANGSSIRLEIKSASIKVPSDPVNAVDTHDKTINKVRALANTTRNPEDLAQHLQTSECNTFIKYVMGVGQEARVAVLGTGTHETEIEAPSEKEPRHVIMDQVNKRERDPGKIKEEVEKKKSTKLKDDEKQSIESEYNDFTSDYYAHSDRGINEHASPEVGEGFVIISNKEEIATSDMDPDQNFKKPKDSKSKNDSYLKALQKLDEADSKLDIMKESIDTRIKTMKGTWAYHYAGVAAKYDPDIVTFENYNRGKENEWQVRRIFNNLYRDCEDFRKFVWAQTDSLPGGAMGASQRRALLRKAAEAVKEKSLVLSKKWEQAVAEASEAAARSIPANELTYFQMYGPFSEGQSFHQAFTPSTANPITLRIRNSPDLLKQQGAATLKEQEGQIKDVLADTSNDAVNRVLKKGRRDVRKTRKAEIEKVNGATGTAAVEKAIEAGTNALKDDARKIAVSIGAALEGEVEGFAKTSTPDEVLQEIQRKETKWRLLDRKGVKPLMQELKPLVTTLKTLC